MKFDFKGFSFTEVLVALTLSAIVGAFAYQWFSRSFLIQLTQKGVSEYYGTAAGGLEQLRRNLQTVDLSHLKSGYAAFTITKDTRNNDVLDYWIPDPSKAPFRIALNMEVVKYDDAGVSVEASSSSNSLRLDPWPWTEGCVPISPAITATEAPLYAGSSATKQTKILLWAPGFQALTAATQVCHPTSGTTADGLTCLGLYPGSTLSSECDAAGGGPGYIKFTPDTRRYLPSGSLIGRPVMARRVSLNYPATVVGTPAPTYGYVYSTLGYNTIDNVSSVPATTLSFTFDVNGVETAYSASLDWSKVTAINANIGGVLQTRDANGNATTKTVPYKLKVKISDQSSEYEEPKPEDKSKLTPELAALSGRGFGQPAVDEVGGTYLYVPTIVFDPTNIEASLGYINVYTVSGSTLTSATTPIGPLKWQNSGGTLLNFLPAKVVATTSGLVIGGYARDNDGTTKTRRAVLYHLPRVGGLSTNRIDWTVPIVTHRFAVMGDENGSVIVGANAGHKYYMADTMNIAVNGNTIYWASFTLPGLPNAVGGYILPQVYKTTLTSPTISTAYTAVHEMSASATANTNRRLMSAMALNAAGDHMYLCYDYLALESNTAWSANYGGIWSGNPTTSSSVAHVDSVTYTDNEYRMGSLYQFTTMRGSCTGMDTDANNFYVSSRTNFFMWPQVMVDDMLDSGTSNSFVADQWDSGSGGIWSGNYYGQNDLGADYMSTESGRTSYSLRGVIGFGIKKSVTSRGELYYAAIPTPASPDGSFGFLWHEALGATNVRTAMRLSSVTTASLMNQTSATTVRRSALTLPQINRFFPSSGYNTTTNTFDHPILNCQHLFTAGDTWDNCVRRRLGARNP